MISIIIPAHNEENGLTLLSHKILAILDKQEKEIIIVDDGSQDNTWDEIQQLHYRFSEIYGIRLTRNFGHQAAILAGLQASRGDAVITMDADGQHPPEMLPSFISEWEKGARVVQGLRRHTIGGGIFKNWSSKLFYRILSCLSGVHIPPGSADFRLLSRCVVTLILQNTNGIVFLRGTIPWLGFRTIYLPFISPNRSIGKTSFSIRRMIHFSLDGIFSFSIIPLRLAIWIGITISFFSFFYLAYILIIAIFSTDVIPGWASMTGLLAFLGGIQLLTMGILGEYVGRHFVTSLKRPFYVVDQYLIEHATHETAIK